MGPFLNGKLYPHFFPIWTKNSQSENPSYWLSSFNFSSILPARLYAFFQIKAYYMYKEIKWASSWDYGTYHIGDQRRLSLEPSLVTHTEVQTKGPTKNQTSSSTAWLCMRVRRMSLQRTKSTIISWHGSLMIIGSTRQSVKKIIKETFGEVFPILCYTSTKSQNQRALGPLPKIAK